MKSLLVEDNPADVRLIREMLKESPTEPFELQQAARLDSALERLRQEPFDVLLLDLGLADSQGLETLTRAQQAARHLPIVVLTGLKDERFSREAVRAGAQDYLVKGRFDSELLVRTIHHAVERKRAEEALRASDRRFRTLFELAPDAIFLVDQQGRFVDGNHAAEEMVGYARHELIGKSFLNLGLLSPEGLERAAASLATNAQGRPTGPEEYVLNRRDGRQVPVEIRSFPIPLQERELVMGVARDLTEHKSLQKQLLRAQRVESIGTLASGIAHDLNNILAPILMSAQLLQLQKPGKEEREILATIQASAQRGAEIVKQVLTFARGIEGQRVAVQARHLLREMQKIAEETFPKNITLKVSLPRDLRTVTGDATHLHQVLMNLCVNARDAMPDGGTLLLSAENVQVAKAKRGLFADGQAGPHVLIQVSDTGQGIPPALIEQVFAPFFTTKEQGKGTGLGLSTVLGIVRSHGGFVDVESKPGCGSTFKIYLPARPAQAALPVDATPPTPPRGTGERILVVDDEANIRAVTERTLTRHGYRVLTAANGKEALELVARHSPDIKAVVLDVMMPVMDGVALAHALKESHPQMPLIACTGWGQEGVRAKLKALGVDSLLEKPYPAAALLTVLCQQLTGAGSHPRPATSGNSPARGNSAAQDQAEAGCS